MDIEQAVAIVQDEGVGKHAHEPGQHHQIRGEGIDLVGQGHIECGPGGEAPVIDDPRLDAALAGERQPGGIGPIADHRDDLGSGDAGIDDGLHVGATTADQNDDAAHRRASAERAAPVGFRGSGPCISAALHADPGRPSLAQPGPRQRRQRQGDDDETHRGQVFLDQRQIAEPVPGQRQ